MAALLLVACSAPGPEANPASGASPGTEKAEQATQTETLTVYAAASLGRAFTELAEQFAEAHPQIDLRPMVFDGSSTLATQIAEGAPADVFASANKYNMNRLVDAGLLNGTAAIFATNTLVIAVPANNPKNVASLADLSNVTTVLCAPEVPCGTAAMRLLAQQGVEVTPASIEQNVTAVLQKVAAGEADAGLVYATDVMGVSEVLSIVPEGAERIVSSYPVAAIAGSRSTSPDAAHEFIDFLQGDEGQSTLARYGFGPGSSLE